MLAEMEYTLAAVPAWAVAMIIVVLVAGAVAVWIARGGNGRGPG